MTGRVGKPTGLSQVSALTGFDPSRLGEVAHDMVSRGLTNPFFAHLETILEARDAFQKLNAEIERRDRNEHRNCINWGPCGRNDLRMSEGEYAVADGERPASAIEARSDATPKSGAAEGESAVPNGETPR